MAKLALRGRTAAPGAATQEPPAGVEARLGLNVPAGWWPAAPTLKGFEAAGYRWVQVHAPPPALLRDPGARGVHARALRRELDTSGLRLVLHAPDDLSAGSPEMDLALEGLVEYAADAGAELVVYHAANYADGPCARERLELEERALREQASRMRAGGVTFALENLAPVYPSPPRLCHRPDRIAALVERLDSAAFGMCFDVGHANIVSDELGTDPAALLSPLAERVALFHVHDNYGSRSGGRDASGVDPLRLDLHLPPGRGTVPWERVSPALAEHTAPLLLEIHPPNRPRPVQLATVSTHILSRPREKR